MSWKDYLAGTAGPGIPLLLYLIGVIKPESGDVWLFRGLFPLMIVWLLVKAHYAYRKAAKPMPFLWPHRVRVFAGALLRSARRGL